jgi:hypothetical protein
MSSLEFWREFAAIHSLNRGARSSNLAKNTASEAPISHRDEFVGRDKDVDIALVMLGAHVVHFGDQGPDVGSHLLDGVVDEGLFTGELFQWRFEVALTKFSNTCHGLFLLPMWPFTMVFTPMAMI